VNPAQKPRSSNLLRRLFIVVVDDHPLRRQLVLYTNIHRAADCAIQNPNGPPLIPNVTVKFNESLVRAGVNYKFGG
jgi:hypothetical protein